MATSAQPKPMRYPLLETLLAAQGKALKGTYSVRDIAELFEVSTRTIQIRVKRGSLRPRDLPGHAKFLAGDIEEFLQGGRT